MRDGSLEETYRSQNGKIGAMIYDAELQGDRYQSDAFRTLQILREWTSGGTAETHTDGANDVLTAWGNLTDTYDGEDAKSATIMRARETIRIANWSKDGNNFKFADYCNKHMTANNDLNRYGANIDGEGQVNAFLLGIKLDATINPQLLPIKAAILMNTTCKDNIGKAVITFKDTEKKIGIVMSGGNSRSIGAFYRGGKRDGDK